MKLNKKTFLISALLGSIGIGVYYMGKAKIIKNLVAKGLVNVGADGKYYLNKAGTNNLIEITTENGTKYYINNKATGNAFDYNNPAYHASSDYYISQNATYNVMDNAKNVTMKIENGEIKLNIDNTGAINPSVLDSVLANFNYNLL